MLFNFICGGKFLSHCRFDCNKQMQHLDSTCKFFPRPLHTTKLPISQLDLITKPNGGKCHFTPLDLRWLLHLLCLLRHRLLLPGEPASTAWPRTKPKYLVTVQSLFLSFFCYWMDSFWLYFSLEVSLCCLLLRVFVSVLSFEGDSAYMPSVLCESDHWAWGKRS